MVKATHEDMRARRKAAQPSGIKTFGSTFKNPDDARAEGRTAGQLLEAAGIEDEELTELEDYGLIRRVGRQYGPEALAVARVVAASDSNGIGMAAPATQASTNRTSSSRCPLSCPPRGLIVS